MMKTRYKPRHVDSHARDAKMTKANQPCRTTCKRTRSHEQTEHKWHVDGHKQCSNICTIQSCKSKHSLKTGGGLYRGGGYRENRWRRDHETWRKHNPSEPSRQTHKPCSDKQNTVVMNNLQATNDLSILCVGTNLDWEDGRTALARCSYRLVSPTCTGRGTPARPTARDAFARYSRGGERGPPGKPQGSCCGMSSCRR